MNQLSSNLSKPQQRQEASRRRNALSDDERRLADAAICRRLADMPELQHCDLLAAFIASGAEPDLTSFRRDFAARGGQLFLPRSRRDAAGTLEYEMAGPVAAEDVLVGGAFGIPEPAPQTPSAGHAELHQMVWLVPGVAFDRQGRRLGRGKGFYDRLLAGSPGKKIGVFYECQQMAEVPAETHDCPLDAIVTEARIYRRLNN